MLSPSSRTQSELSLIVYGHIHNLHGIIASWHYPTSMSHVLTRAQPLGGLAAHYLTSHRYSVCTIAFNPWTMYIYCLQYASFLSNINNKQPTFRPVLWALRQFARVFGVPP
ncbi:hypothetical protein PAXRUDRAFT_153537 [Paxillus rubicundulus Ve08.2h10]|uniref:Uncharacterized protein n=1 Tax=Paxillus rubicundulus Ve08.2h10 TaxID=930991 RepID=A0A0D0CJ23_9AGAM|nr:hypothetical protein PAXRUDRAFT_153537 [Paxillus rubicundulus Ve08.2h10]